MIEIVMINQIDFDLDILVTLVCEEQEFIRPVLSMMREVAELANVDRAALWHQLCASEDEIMRVREESKTEISNMAKEKSMISQKLTESEATSNRLKVFHVLVDKILWLPHLNC